MATVTDTLVTKHVLDNKQYMSGAQDILKATGGMSSAFSSIAGVSAGAAAGIGIIAGAIGAVVAGTVALAKASFDYGSFAVQQSASFDASRKALQVYAGSAEEAARQIGRLKIVAEAPGLGFREAVQGSVRLQAIGFTAEGAERTLKALGNALASAGGGKAELDGIVMALSQIIGKGTVSAEEINQIAERFPGIRKVMTDTFGTANAEIIQQTVGPAGFITGIITGLEKLPKSAGSAQTSIENLKDVIDQINIGVGDTLFAGLARNLEELTDYIAFVGRSGVLDSIAANIAAIFGVNSSGMADGLIYGADKFLTAMELGSMLLKDAVKFLSSSLQNILKFLSPLPIIGNIANAAMLGIANVQTAGLGLDMAQRLSFGMLGTGGMGAFDQYKADRKRAREEEAKKKADDFFKDQSNNQKATAENTRKMVELQQKAIDLQQTLLGGGAFAKQGFSQVNLSRIIGGSQMERGIRMAVVGMVNGIGDFGVQQNRMGY